MPGDFRHPLDISPAGLGMSLAGHDYGIGIVLSVFGVLLATDGEALGPDAGIPCIIYRR